MNEFIQKIEALLELPAGALKAETELQQLAEWNSMAAVGFLAMADGEYGKSVSPSEVSKCKTAGDLAKLVNVE